MTSRMSSNISYDPIWNKCLNVCGLLGLSLRLFSEGTTDTQAGKGLNLKSLTRASLTRKI